MNRSWHILGAGAIGSLFAAKLQNAGEQVVLLDHHQTPESGRRSLTGEPPVGNFQFPVSLTTDTQPIDHLLVTTKSYAVIPALRSVTHRLSSGAQLVVMVNGMGIAEQCKALLPAFSLVLGSTTEGAFRENKHTIVHAGTGITHLGDYRTTPGVSRSHEQAAHPGWFAPWRSTGACEWDSNINDRLWLKLAINAAINPLTALHQCKNGELVRQPAYLAQVMSLCDEIQAVALAAGNTAWAKDLPARVIEVIERTANNRSSMLQDILAGRPTEINDITGWRVKRESALSVAKPTHSELLAKFSETYPNQG